MLARRCAIAASVAVAAAMLPPFVAPARAETIYLKNGTQIKGKITRQDEDNFDVLTQQGPIKVAKARVALQDLPNPVIAAGLGIGFPGAGQAYVGRWDKAAFYFAITSVTLGAAFAIGMVSSAGGFSVTDSSKLALPATIGVTTAAIPLGLGSYDAYLEAVRINAEPKFKIDYGESL